MVDAIGEDGSTLTVGSVLTSTDAGDNDTDACSVGAGVEELSGAGATGLSAAGGGAVCNVVVGAVPVVGAGDAIVSCGGSMGGGIGGCFSSCVTTGLTSSDAVLIWWS